MKKEKGFTLVELIVLLAILAIVLGIANRGYQRWLQNYNLRAEAQVLRVAVKKAVELAKGGNVDYFIVFDLENNTYNIFDAEQQDNRTHRIEDARVKITMADFGGNAYALALARGCLNQTGMVVMENRIGSRALLDFGFLGSANISYEMK